MVNYLFLRLILRMERTTNPSVEVPSDAAIAAAITAISSELSASCTGSAATVAGVGAAAASSAAFFFAFAYCAPDPGINWNREIRKISIIRITNTVPSPITVFSAAFFIVVAKEYLTSTESDVGVRFLSNT